MARPKTKSDPILFRLPLAVYDHLAGKARKKKMTPSQYLAKAVTDDYENSQKGQS